MNEAIELLETKIAFLEAANAEMSDEIFRQQKELDALRERVTQLVGRIEELASKPQEWKPEEEVPPHY